MRVRHADTNLMAIIIENAPFRTKGINRYWKVQVEGRGLDSWAEHKISEVSQELTLQEKLQQKLFSPLSDFRALLTHSRLSGKLADMVYSFNTADAKFFPHQYKAVLSFLQSQGKGILIADEVGLGKTIEAGFIWMELRARIAAKNLVILCPAALAHKWKKELLQKFSLNSDICETQKDFVAKLLEMEASRVGEKILIVSMQGGRNLADAEEDSAEATRYNQILDRYNSSMSLIPFIDLLIIDEAHYLKNRSTLTFKFGQGLATMSRKVVGLSATPINLSQNDLFSLLNILDPVFFPDEKIFERIVSDNEILVKACRYLYSFETNKDNYADIRLALISYFKSKYPDMLFHVEPLINTPASVLEKDHFKRIEVIKELDSYNQISQIVNRTLKRQVFENRIIRRPESIGWVPESIELNLYLDIKQIIRKICEKYSVNSGLISSYPERFLCSSIPAACHHWEAHPLAIIDNSEFIEELDPDLPSNTSQPYFNVFSQELYREITKVVRAYGGYNAFYAIDTKYKNLVSLIKSYQRENPGKKLVLFAYFRSTLSYLHERLSKDSISSLLLMGGMTDKVEKLDQFKNEDFDILLSSEVLSEGVDLQYSAMLINYDIPWNPMKIEQRIGRVDRIGQEAASINIANFFMKGSLDEKVLNILHYRMEKFEQVLGAAEDVLGNELKQLADSLFTHVLTEEEEIKKIHQSAIAINEQLKIREQLEASSAEFQAYHDYLKTQITSVQQFDRYVTVSDLEVYIKDFFDKIAMDSSFERTNQPLIKIPDDDHEYFQWRLILGAGTRKQLFDFINNNGLSAKTVMHDQTRDINFIIRTRDSDKLRRNSNIEVISQYHPLIRFIKHQYQTQYTEKQSACIALSIKKSQLIDAGVNTDGIACGDYAFMADRWIFEGKELFEKIESIVIPLTNYEGGTKSINFADKILLTALSSGCELDKRKLGAYSEEILSDAYYNLTEEMDLLFSTEKKKQESKFQIYQQESLKYSEAEKRKKELAIKSSFAMHDEHSVYARLQKGKLDKLLKEHKELSDRLALNSFSVKDKSIIGLGILRIEE